MPPAIAPVPAGFFAPDGNQTQAAWSTIAVAVGLSVLQRKRDVSLPVNARRMNALRALQRKAPELSGLAAGIALAFNATMIENPQMARLILEKICRRMVAQQPVVKKR